MAILFVAGEEDPAAWVPALRARLPEARVLTEADAFEPHEVAIAIVANPPAGALRDLPGLRLVQSLWMGVDGLVADPTVPSGVPIARMVDPEMTSQMPEAALAHVLFLHRLHDVYGRQQRERVWRQWPQPLAGARRVGVLGLGELGARTAAALAASGFSGRYSRARSPRPAHRLARSWSLLLLNSRRDRDLLTALSPSVPGQRTGAAEVSVLPYASGPYFCPTGRVLQPCISWRPTTYSHRSLHTGRSASAARGPSSQPADRRSLHERTTPMLEILKTAGSALTAQRLRMDVISSNLANAEATSTPEGGPYKRERVVFGPVLRDSLSKLAALSRLDRQRRGLRRRRSQGHRPGRGRPATGLRPDPSRRRRGRLRRLPERRHGHRDDRHALGQPVLRSEHHHRQRRQEHGPAGPGHRPLDRRMTICNVADAHEEH